MGYRADDLYWDKLRDVRGNLDDFAAAVAAAYAEQPDLTGRLLGRCIRAIATREGESPERVWYECISTDQTEETWVQLVVSRGPESVIIGDAGPDHRKQIVSSSETPS